MLYPNYLEILLAGYSSAALDGLSHSSIENSNISNIVLLDDTYEKWISKQQKCEVSSVISFVPLVQASYGLQRIKNQTVPH